MFLFSFLFFFLGIIKKAQNLMSQIFHNISKNLVVVITHRSLGCYYFQNSKSNFHSFFFFSFLKDILFLYIGLSPSSQFLSQTCPDLSQ